jgi:hypothetical protein
VILDDVADRPDLVVEATAPLHAELLGHRDLHVVDVVSIPDRLEERVGEAKDHEVLHGLLAEVVVDAKDVFLGEDLAQRLVERPGRSEIPAEGLLEDDARPAGAPRGAEPIDDGVEHARRGREVVHGTLRRAQRLPERRERGRLAEVALDVAQQAGELLERGGIDDARRGDARQHAGAQLLDRHPRPADADDGHVEPSASNHRLERGEDLLVGEVTGRAEEDKRVGGDGVGLRGGGATGDA